MVNAADLSGYWLIRDGTGCVWMLLTRVVGSEETNLHASALFRSGADQCKQTVSEEQFMRPTQYKRQI